MLVQIFAQLLHNAANHAYKPNEPVKIRIDIEMNDEITINFKDFGKGMKKEEVKKIFDPFYTTSRGQLPGLGMHVVYNQVAQLFKGSIECQSAPNQGCLFIIKIPFMIPD